MLEHGIEPREIGAENHPLHGESREENGRERISETIGGRTFDTGVRRNSADANRGRSLDETTKRKISNSLTGHTRPRSPSAYESVDRRFRQPKPERRVESQIRSRVGDCGGACTRA